MARRKIIYNKNMLSKKIINNKYFEIKSNIYIDARVMNVLTLFFGLTGIPNFITKRYLQGAIHLALLALVILGAAIFGGYFAGMPWGPILIVASYALAFLETKAYNMAHENNHSAMEKIDKSFVVAEWMSIILSLPIILLGTLCVWAFINSLGKSGSRVALGGEFLMFVAAVGIAVLLTGSCFYRKRVGKFKEELLSTNKFTAGHKGLYNAVNVLFVCDIATTIGVILMIVYMLLV